MRSEAIANPAVYLRTLRLEYKVGNGKFYKLGVVGKEADVLITIEATREK